MNARQAIALAVGSAVIFLMTLLVYVPAMRGDFVWDDDAYVINNATLQDAGNRFWLLLVAQGVEDWVQR